MITTRDCVREYLLAGVFNSVTGHNDKTVQYQGNEDGKRWFGLYDTNGDWVRETSDVGEALDYIGLESEEK